MRKWILPLLFLLAVPGTGSLAQEATPRRQSRAELQVRSRELDRRVIELQHALMAARYDRDAEALKRAEEDFKAAQAQRVDTLRQLGDVP